MKNPEELDPDWARYPETVLQFEGSPGLRIDLREHVTEEARGAFERMGLGGTFAVLTAHDPHGKNLSAEENSQRQAELEKLLEGEDLFFQRVDCCSPDGDHCECSMAVKCAQERAAALARSFGQVALFWFDGAVFWMVGGIVEDDPIMLPRNS